MQLKEGIAKFKLKQNRSQNKTITAYHLKYSYYIPLTRK